MINLFLIAEAADTTTKITDAKSLLNFGSDILGKGVIPFLVALGVAAFVFGIIQYYLNPNNEEKRKSGKTFMLWGVIALFVIVSFWGIVGILQNTFNTSGTENNQIKIPKIPEQQS